MTTANYPVQIGRPFVDGEISTCPQAIVGGTPVTTQANVTQHYADGSVKHAIIAFLIPTLTANSSVTVTFQNQASCNTTELTLSQMTAGAYNFDAQIKLTNGSTITADALAMLNAGSYTVWTPGSVAQTVLIANDAQGSTCNSNACSAYDFGFDANRVIRPRFYVTFWPTINKVTVRFVVEIPNTQAVEDQTYSADLYYGSTSPVQVCDWGASRNACPSASFTHGAGQRWTKAGENATAPHGYWIGGAPPTIAIDHNLAYLSSTTALMNFDTTKGTGLAALEGATFTAWNGVTHDPLISNSTGQSNVTSNFPSTGYNSTTNEFSGFWYLYMPGAGDRPDIAMFTGWVTNWLYTMNDYRNFQIALGQADIGSGFPYHLREGDASRNITLGTASPTPACTYQCSAGGVGKFINIVGRPSMGSYNGVLNLANAVGTIASTQWQTYPTHMPDGWTIPYLLTGDYYYLEESYWAGSYMVGSPTPNGANYGRADNVVGGTSGNIANASPNELRLAAWIFRTTANVWAIAPDNTPEKSFFETALNQELAGAEGLHGITGTAYQGTTAWNWANTVQRVSVFAGGAQIFEDQSPLHEYYSGGGTPTYHQAGYGSLGSALGPANGSLASNGQVITVNPGLGNLTVNSGSGGVNITFSNSTDCAAMVPGAVLATAGATGGGPFAVVETVSCPNATIEVGLPPSGPAPFAYTATAASSDGGPFEENYTITSISRAREVFGAPAEPIKAWYSKMFTDTITNPNYNPYLAADYRTVTVAANPTQWVQNVAQKKSLFVGGEQNKASWAPFQGVYVELAYAGIAYVANEANGAAAWTWMSANALTGSYGTSGPGGTNFNVDTRWSILPRGAGGTQLNACDLNSDGVVNSLDVLIAINQAIGAVSCTNAILDGGTSCSIIDVQRIATAALTSVCRVGN